jgi:zinc protease
MRNAPRIVLTSLLLLVTLALTRTSIAEPLPSDPSLVTGKLDNGLTYIVKEHAVPPGRAVMWIHIHSGSLNETERQRGIAHYLEHMAFNGSENFAPGELVPFFQSLGMTFGRDQNAFTSFDQTVYQLSLPNTKTETLEKGMTFFADVVHGLSLSPGEIEAERQIIQEERRRSLSGRRRASDYVLERMTPGSIFGKRQPIGTEATIDGVNQQDFKDYYGKWYGASNATLIVIADEKPETIIGVIKQKFADAPEQPKPTPQELGVKAYDKSFAIVASDPEIRSEEIQIVRLEPARPPVTTVELYRDELVRRLGTSALNQRLSDKTARGGMPWLSCRVSANNMANAIYTAEVSARANPGNWKQALETMALELQRARAYGFTQRELEEQKIEMMSGAERAVTTESTTPAQAIISRINGNVTAGEPTMSAQQRLDLLKKLLPTITPEEVAKTFAKEFDPTAVAFVATLPASSEIPSEQQLVELGTRALAVKPQREEELARASELMKDQPSPGQVTEGAEHASSGVWSGWLSNNVRVHYRYMDQRKDDVSININLIGGELLETKDNRGITSAAQLAWARPATKNLSSTEISHLMTGKQVSVRGGGGGGMGGGRGRRGGGGGGGGGGDGISLSISGSPQDLETGFQLAYLLLTEPNIEQVQFEQFKTTMRTFLEEMLKNPASVGARLAAAAPYPDGEPRTTPITVEQIDRLNLDDAQAWLEKLIAESPIEVVIVGDLSKDRALDLAARYLGALPSRPRVGPNTYAELRKLERPTGPRKVEKTVETATQQAFVLCGFYGADETNRPDVRALSMASRILSTRMVKQVREETQLVYSIGAGSRPASTYPGFGVFSAAAPTEPGKTQPLVEKIQSMYETFATEGPTEEELKVAKGQFANTYEQQLKEPGFWSGRLNQLTFRGISLDDLVEEPEAYQNLTADQVRETFAKYYAKENMIVVVAKPTPGTAAANGQNGAKPASDKKGGDAN